MMIAHNKPWILPGDITAMSASAATGWLAPGPQVAALESAFCRDFGGGQAAAVSSGTAAVFAALSSFGLARGARVAVPTYVCSALLNAIAMANAVPVPVDIAPDDFNMPADAISALDQPVDAIIAVHTYGAPANVNAMTQLTDYLIEDCCQTIGGYFPDGLPMGTVGQAAAFSFYATKIITGGHGGMVYSRQSGAATYTRDYVMFDGRPDWKPRFNFQMTDFQAAMIAQQYARLDKIRQIRRRLYDLFREALPPGYERQSGLDDKSTIPYRFVVRTADAEATLRLQAHLAAAGIQTIVPLRTDELLHRLLGLSADNFPVAEAVAATTLSIPLYPALVEAEIETIIQALKTAPQP